MRSPFNWLPAAAMVLLSCAPAAPAGRGEFTADAAATIVPGPATPLPNVAEHRFFEINPRQVTVSSKNERAMVLLSRARLYARFMPIEDATASVEAPARLCVLFNGGPGIGAQLLWERIRTQLAPVCDQLFLDPRNTGFSYSLNVPSTKRKSAQGNVLSDAAEALLVVLAHLLERPASHVTLIGESYGATRSSVMYELARGVRASKAGNWSYADSELEAAASIHGAPFAELIDSVAYLQPYLGGVAQDEIAGQLLEQPGSIIDLLAAELGETYVRCKQPCYSLNHAEQQVAAWGRSIYDTRENESWLTDDLQWLSRQTAILAQDAEFTALPELRPESRTLAWRYLLMEPPEEDEAWKALGPLNDNDRYYVPFNEDVFAAVGAPLLTADVSHLSARWAESAVTVFANAAVFVTDAKYDTVVVSGALPELLRRSPRITSVVVHDNQWQSTFVGGQVSTATVKSYEAGHAIGATEPDALGADLRAWLRQLSR